MTQLENHHALSLPVAKPHSFLEVETRVRTLNCAVDMTGVTNYSLASVNRIFDRDIVVASVNSVKISPELKNINILGKSGLVVIWSSPPVIAGRRVNCVACPILPRMRERPPGCRPIVKFDLRFDGIDFFALYP